MPTWKSWLKMFVSNKEVLRAIHFRTIVVMLLFVINVSLISVPNFYGRMESIAELDNLIGIEEALDAIYDAQLDCHVENAEMHCADNVDAVFGAYDFMYRDALDLEGIETSTIYFAQDAAVFIYVDENDMAYSSSGDYSLLEGFDFATVKTGVAQGESLDEHYADTTDFLLTSIYHSSLPQQFLLIYLSQFMQMLIYLMILTLIFLLVNFKADRKKLTFQSANKIIVVSMTGPAFLVALIGMFVPSWASILFFIIFAVRAMFIYYRINFSKDDVYT